jgi:hypothetical protein
MIPLWRGKSPGLPPPTYLNDCPIFRHTPFYCKNKFNVNRKEEHKVISSGLSWNEDSSIMKQGQGYNVAVPLSYAQNSPHMQRDVLPNLDFDYYFSP